MGVGGWALLAAMMGAAFSLRCHRCDLDGCTPTLCAPHHHCCRYTSIVTRHRSGALWQEEQRDCSACGVPNITVSFRSVGDTTVTLREWHCRGDGCNADSPPAPPPTSGPAPLCPTCADGSCPSPPFPPLRCAPPDVCLQLRAGVGDGAPPGDSELWGCGRVGEGRCRGLLEAESDGGVRGARCCDGGCAEDPPAVGLRCWSCEGPAPHCRPTALRCRPGLNRCVTANTYDAVGSPWIFRGCASPQWCGAPVGLWGGIRGAPPKCCGTPFCNGLPGDPPPPHSSAPHVWGFAPLLPVLHLGLWG